MKNNLVKFEKLLSNATQIDFTLENSNEKDIEAKILRLIYRYRL